MVLAKTEQQEPAVHRRRRLVVGSSDPHEHGLPCTPHRRRGPRRHGRRGRGRLLRARRASGHAARPRWASAWTTSPAISLETVEKVQEDGIRARIVESLAQPLDLDEVLARCAEAAASLPGVAGALVTVELDGIPHTAQSGLGRRRASASSAARRTGAPCAPSESPTTTRLTEPRAGRCSRRSRCRSTPRPRNSGS